jgi:hypothetical protein
VDVTRIAFSETYVDIGGWAVFVQGRIVGDVLEADVSSRTCEHHWHLKRRADGPHRHQHLSLQEAAAEEAESLGARWPGGRQDRSGVTNRHAPTWPVWRSASGDDSLPSTAEALALPLGAFPGWYLRMECATCGQERYLSQSQLVRAGKGGEVTRDFIAGLRHSGCGGRPRSIELVTNLSGFATVRRVVLMSARVCPVCEATMTERQAHDRFCLRSPPRPNCPRVGHRYPPRSRFG